jgi:glycine C-acetyltransferase
MANAGVFHALLKRPGSTNYVDTIYNDANNHPSIEYGVKLALASLDKVRHLTYRNNDIAHLTTLLESSLTSHGRLSIIVTSGMFYSEGGITQLDGLLKLRDKYQAILYLDDSHGIGVLGANGRGVAEEQGFLGKPDLIAGTFGKALGGACGGFIAGKRETIEYLRQNAITYINSNALPPAVVCASIEAINILEEDSSLVNKLRENTSYFRSELRNLGFNISPGFHPTILLLIGDETLAKRASQELLNNGVYCRDIGYPLVGKGAARLRLQISAGHTRQELDQALEAIASVGQRLKLLA